VRLRRFEQSPSHRTRFRPERTVVGTAGAGCESRGGGHRFIDRGFRLTTWRSRTAPTTALCRGPPRGVSRSDPKAGTSVKRASRNPSTSLAGCTSNSPRLPPDLRCWHGSPTPLERWRERPHGWPQAWQAKRPTGWSLTPLDCCWGPLWQWRDQAGGTKRRQRLAAGNWRRCLEFSPAARVRGLRLLARRAPRWDDAQGGTPRAKSCSPPRSPSVTSLGCFTASPSR
jgi:hypothetical protein